MKPITVTQVLDGDETRWQVNGGWASAETALTILLNAAETQRDNARVAHQEAVALAIRYRDEMDRYRDGLQEVRRALEVDSEWSSEALLNAIDDALSITAEALEDADTTASLTKRENEEDV